MPVTDDYRSRTDEARRAIVADIVKSNLSLSFEQLLEEFEGLDDDEAVEIFKTTALEKLLYPSLGATPLPPKNGARRRTRKPKAEASAPATAPASAKPAPQRAPKASRAAPPRVQPTDDGCTAKVLSFLREHSESGKSAICEATGISDKQFRHAIDHLVREGEIERTGHGRGAKYSA